MTNLFHNPYHFIPYSKDNSKEHWLDIEKFKHRQLDHKTHSRYLSGNDIFHGRLVCRLTTESPIFIGGVDDTDDADEKKSSENSIRTCPPFEIDGERAIPPSTLRGLISSIAEAASNSSLRVMEDCLFSRRKAMNEALGAVGLLKKDKKDGKLKLLPLTLPVFPFGFQEGVRGGKWERIFTQPALPVHLKGYKKDEKNGGLEIDAESFLGKNENDRDSFSHSNQEYWYIKLGNVSWDRNGILQIKKVPQNDPITQQAYEKYPEEKKGAYSRGILRILGIKDREKEIPEKKTKELFLPLPEESPNKLLSIDKPLALFEKLARERAKKDKKYPFLPKGRKEEEAESFALRENDLVYFTINDNGEVTELAVSSIWRQDLGMLYEFFEDKELLPFNCKREKISPAELLFGFVEQRDKKKGKEKKEKEKEDKKEDTSALSFSSRLRFSYGRLAAEEKGKDILEPPVLLKILDSPKPPSPALYFTARNNPNNSGPIIKKSLKPALHKPQGRKFYLHHRREELEQKFWETADKENRLKQKVRITPIKSGVSFWFHIDFDNLSRYELGMLLYALSPTSSFRHKIGMGKPLGLGTVYIQPVALQEIDRQKRYCDDDIFSPPGRYSSTTVFPGVLNGDIPPACYSGIREGEADQTIMERQQQLETIKEEFTSTIPREIRNALALIGDPEKVRYPVHYPLQESQTNYEDEGFKWFVENENPQKGQQLSPIDKDIPYLKRN